MGISSIVDKIEKLLDGVSSPASILPPTLLKYTSLQRPGLSPYKIASEVIKNNSKLGIPTGKNPDGSDNKINQHDYNLIKTIVNAIKEEAVVHIAIPANSVMIQGTGGNAGGPVIVTGSNLIDSEARGIIR